MPLTARSVRATSSIRSLVGLGAPAGARIDVAFEGDIKGRITGKIRRGVEYLALRADGRTDLDGRATVETEDGHRIAMRIEGGATPRANEPMMDLIANVVSSPQLRSMIGSTRGRFGVSPLWTWRWRSDRRHGLTWTYDTEGERKPRRAGGPGGPT